MSVAVVTGANRGIGPEHCKQLKASGMSVIGACRSTSPELDALGITVVTGVDVSELSSINSLAAACEGKTISALVNNAGILTQEGLESLDYDAVRKQFEVNAIGPLAITNCLRPYLASGSKVLMVTSRMGSIGDNGSGGMYGYRMSKAALNAGAMSLAIDLKKVGVAVGIVHPGMVETGMTAGFGAKAGVGSTIDTTTSAAGCLRSLIRWRLTCHSYAHPARLHDRLPASLLILIPAAGS